MSLRTGGRIGPLYDDLKANNTRSGTRFHQRKQNVIKVVIDHLELHEAGIRVKHISIRMNRILKNSDVGSQKLEWIPGNQPKTILRRRDDSYFTAVKP